MTGSAKTSEARGAHSELSKGDGEGEKTIGSAKTSETRGAHSELNRGEDERRSTAPLTIQRESEG
jgi:hypothetical protein